MSRIVVYTDGACSGNPGPGAWAAIVGEKVLTGTDSHTTNNRMEMTAVIRALESIKEESYIIVNTDAKYISDNLVISYRWKTRGWKGSSGKIKNIDLWDSLHEAINRHSLVEIRWVKGHHNNLLNNRADNLATIALEQLKYDLGLE